MYTNRELINETLFKIFIYLKQNNLSHRTLTSIVTEKLVQAEKCAFFDVYDEFTMNNFILHFNSNVSFAYINNDNSIEHLNVENNVITDKFKAIVLFERGNVYIVKSNFRKYIKFKSNSGSLCRDCGNLFSDKRTHNKHCIVSGTHVNIGLKVWGASRGRDIVKATLDSLGITEDFESKEPDLYLRRNVTFEDSSVLVVNNERDTLRTIFNLFFYNNYEQTHLKQVSKSRKCQMEYERFIRIYKNVTIDNLNLFFKRVTLKFYFKSVSTNKVTPCTFTRPVSKKHINLVYIIDNMFISPRSHLLKFIRLKGRYVNNCPLCRQFYANPFKHSTDCIDLCTQCLTKCNTPYGENEPNYLSCISCGYYFNSQLCFTRHLRKICNKIFICKACQLEVNMYTKSNAKHKCRVRYCNTCRTTIPVNDFTHQCLIKNIRLRPKKQGSVRLYMDIKAYTDKKCNERFVACLLVAKSACDNCPPTNEVPCITCKSINKTFLGVR